jgi:AraC-like DNA-binding protein
LTVDDIRLTGRPASRGDETATGPGRRRPTTSLTAAIGLADAIEAAGQDPDRILRPLGLDRRRLMDAHGVIPSVDFARMLEDAARLTGDECFGLHFGERFHPKDIGALAYVVLNSPTFGVGFANVARYLRVHNEAAEASVEPGPVHVCLRHRLRLPAALRRQHNEYSLTVGLDTIRLMAGREWTPVEAHFEHPAPARSSEQLRVFGAPVSFGRPTNALVIERRLVDQPVPAADPRLYPILRRYLDRVLEEMPPADGLLASVRRAIAESMRHGDPTLAHVARRLAMGRRTLQRHLKAQGADFAGLVEATRRAFALRYLRDWNNTLTDVSYLLGYSEVSAFNRAFRRWTASTPSEYRRGLSRR